MIYIDRLAVSNKNNNDDDGSTKGRKVWREGGTDGGRAEGERERKRKKRIWRFLIKIINKTTV